jgi:hypothetical protein
MKPSLCRPGSTGEKQPIARCPLMTPQVALLALKVVEVMALAELTLQSIAAATAIRMVRRTGTSFVDGRRAKCVG